MGNYVLLKILQYFIKEMAQIIKLPTTEDLVIESHGAVTGSGAG